MIKIIKTNSDHKDFKRLVKDLDAYLAVTDGDEHAFYDQFNGIESLDHVVLAYDIENAIGCGAFKKFDETSVEIKRMYTIPEFRGKGIASKIINALELWASELNYEFCILETGKRQVEAVKFYKKKNYENIANYGQYIGMDNSLCFKKRLN
ncbi:GNAT family N-acetyltransferase [Psychroserpens sp.]|uniref:GNAT family N-acetyltransferase n=1 Tax=Psychroserpens sp. TaxID=2020870 RepID=UPI001B17541A|nr:GNAT family N-acetyltransferase [Psychroserpens sp.]MBO6607171.1 GNAT family N-acetyltransferase [Psychroserpens sp.]MBO6631752.1 GNAT family N-acetyltransferase [Psychroserpens sp.]MBO6654317.1 GNAT family N-acetyltransferase [Psychroserpens sp.]MBO6682397.1 GNAT family N-acetyltransferase [Psychroserpens sp.]MBO6750943.1 GNAT family N-acetyltransferase [Psychroserpens sp.]